MALSYKNLFCIHRIRREIVFWLLGDLGGFGCFQSSERVLYGLLPSKKRLYVYVRCWWICDASRRINKCDSYRNVWFVGLPHLPHREMSHFVRHKWRTFLVGKWATLLLCDSQQFFINRYAFIRNVVRCVRPLKLRNYTFSSKFYIFQHEHFSRFRPVLMILIICIGIMHDFCVCLDFSENSTPEGWFWEIAVFFINRRIFTKKACACTHLLLPR